MIKRGTTPTVTIFTKDLDLSDIEKLELYFSQAQTVLIKQLKDLTVDEEKKSFSYTLTQQETFSFKADRAVEVQFRAKLTNGKVVGSNIDFLNIYEMIGKGEDL